MTTGPPSLPAGCARLLLLALLLALPAAADDAAEAEALVLVRYHEGFPPEYGSQISAAGAERLAEMLADPAFSAHHATAMEALAASGQPAAYPALLAYHERDPGAELDAHQLRARRVLPGAMARLADDDERALAWLLEAAARTGPAPFRAGPHDAAALGAHLRRQALLGLGLSGRPEALGALRRVAAGADPAAARAARRALDLHAAEAGR